jgi:hypothetical protein
VTVDPLDDYYRYYAKWSQCVVLANDCPARPDRARGWGEPVAAIANAGGARYAPRVVIRALLRVILLGGLVAVGWLLGSGISYADDDLWQPTPGLVHVADAMPSDDGIGRPAAVEPTIKKVLSAAAVPRLPVQPPAELSILRPVVKAVGIAKPLNQVLPVSGPLSVPAQHAASAPHTAAITPPVQVDKPATVPPAAPTVAGQDATLASASVPAIHATPTRVCSPAQPAAKSMTLQATLSDGPVSPMPANPPVSPTSLCTIGGAAGGTSSKNGPDIAVHHGWLIDGLAQPDGFLDRDTSGLPRSLSVQPSTSPD